MEVRKVYGIVIDREKRRNISVYRDDNWRDSGGTVRSRLVPPIDSRTRVYFYFGFWQFFGHLVFLMSHIIKFLKDDVHLCMLFTPPQCDDYSRLLTTLTTIYSLGFVNHPAQQNKSVFRGECHHAVVRGQQINRAVAPHHAEAH